MVGKAARCDVGTSFSRRPRNGTLSFQTERVAGAGGYCDILSRTMQKNLVALNLASGHPPSITTDVWKRGQASCRRPVKLKKREIG